MGIINLAEKMLSLDVRSQLPAPAKMEMDNIQ